VLAKASAGIAVIAGPWDARQDVPGGASAGRLSRMAAKFCRGWTEAASPPGGSRSVQVLVRIQVMSLSPASCPASRLFIIRLPATGEVPR